MSGFVRGLTGLLIALPIAMAATAWAGAGPARAVLGLTAAFVALVYLAVWGWWRPRRFELDADGLRIVWPWRTRWVPAHELGAAEEIDVRELRRRYGFVVRVGAGGLWGVFGWLWSSKGWLEVYASRHDRFVLVARAGAQPLLISPDDPGAFLARLGALHR
jgi:hypothetical protein